MSSLRDAPRYPCRGENLNDLDDWPVPDRVWEIVNLPELQTECVACRAVLRYDPTRFGRFHIAGSDTRACRLYAALVLGGRL